MPETPVRAAVFVSGGGSNLEALLQAKAEGRLPMVEFALVISSKADVFALERAKKHQVPTVVIERNSFPTEEDFQDAVVVAVERARIDLILLAGYLRKIGSGLIQRYAGRILNIHPALLPKYGGPGMYGHHVHEAVLAAGEKESGCSVHVVDEEFDHGPVLAQARVPVKPGDTAEQLAARVLEKEHELYPKVVADFARELKSKR